MQLVGNFAMLQWTQKAATGAQLLNNNNYKACVNYTSAWGLHLAGAWVLVWGLSHHTILEPGHGDKIKLNCFMTVLNCQAGVGWDRAAKRVPRGLTRPEICRSLCSLWGTQATGLKSQPPSVCSWHFLGSLTA